MLTLTSAILAVSFALSEKRDGLFQVLTPLDLIGDERVAWASRAYDSWWAGTNHPLGFSLYLVLAFLMFYIILVQNVVGVTCIYIFIALPIVVGLDVDWLNRDGRYGWSPLARLYRTVYLSMIMHGLTISVIIIFLGTENFPWVRVLVVVWMILATLHIIAPWFVLRKVGPEARKKRVRQIEKAMQCQGINIVDDIAKLQPFLAEIDRVWTAKIRPLRMRVFAAPTVAVAVLPVALTVAEIVFSVRFGGR